LITSLIFDVDGTILDTEKAILKSLQRILKEELNKDYTLDALEFALGIPGKEALKKLNVPNINVIHPKWSKAVLGCFCPSPRKGGIRGSAEIYMLS